MIGTAKLVVGGGSLALVGTILALGMNYYRTLDTISRTDGEVVPQQVPIPEIPQEHRVQARQIIDGYQDHYFDPVEQLGEQAHDPNAPDPVAKPLPDVDPKVLAEAQERANRFPSPAASEQDS